MTKTKKELKDAYKRQKPQAGVFQVQNKTNGRVLIEGATNMPSKWNRHRAELRFGSHRNQQLQKDWNEAGEDNFVYSVLSELKIKEGEAVNLNEEVKLLKEMVEDEIEIHPDLRY